MFDDEYPYALSSRFNCACSSRRSVVSSSSFLLSKMCCFVCLGPISGCFLCSSSTLSSNIMLALVVLSLHLAMLVAAVLMLMLTGLCTGNVSALCTLKAITLVNIHGLTDL